MAKKNDLTEFLDFNSLNNLVKEPTCFKGTPSVIDLIVTNKPKRFKCTHCVDIGLSDFHSLVCTATKQVVPKPTICTFKYRSYKKFNNDLFLHDLSRIHYQGYI